VTKTYKIKHPNLVPLKWSRRCTRKRQCRRNSVTLKKET